MRIFRYVLHTFLSVEDSSSVCRKLIVFFKNVLPENAYTYVIGGELSNFATGVLLPTNVADNLLSRTEKGREQMDTFVKQRLEISEVNFWDPVPNLKVKSFSTMAKKTNDRE